jgi:SOS response regulatory protein OraA/RecX
VGIVVQLAELQRVYRAEQRSRHRAELRKYLLEHIEPSPTAYQIVSRRLYAEGAIDNLGLADAWIGSATETERASLFSDIATALLGVP